MEILHVSVAWILSYYISKNGSTDKRATRKVSRVDVVSSKHRATKYQRGFETENTRASVQLRAGAK